MHTRESKNRLWIFRDASMRISIAIAIAISISTAHIHHPSSPPQPSHSINCMVPGYPSSLPPHTTLTAMSSRCLPNAQ